MTHMIEYKGYSVDLMSLPSASIVALANRGLQRVLGSEAAAKVSTWKKAQEEAKVEVTEDQIATKAREAYDAALSAILAGTLGTRAPRAEPVDPIEKEMHSIAKAKVTTALKAAGISVPKGENVVTFDSGDSYTLSDLIDRQLEKREGEIRKEAEKSLKAKAKAKAEAEAKANEVKASGPVTADALGL